MFQFYPIFFARKISRAKEQNNHCINNKSSILICMNIWSIGCRSCFRGFMTSYINMLHYTVIALRNSIARFCVSIVLQLWYSCCCWYYEILYQKKILERLLHFVSRLFSIPRASLGDFFCKVVIDRAIMKKSMSFNIFYSR